MGEKGLSVNLQARIVSSKAGYDYDQEPVLNVVTSKAAKASCHAVTKMVSDHEGMTVNGVISILLSVTGRKQESKSSAITSMRNGVTPCCALSSSEKVASRMPTWGRTDQEANALGNSKDMQTWLVMEDRVMSSSTEVMSHEETRRHKWNQIPWATVEKNVFKLQK